MGWLLVRKSEFKALEARVATLEYEVKFPVWQNGNRPVTPYEGPVGYVSVKDTVKYMMMILGFGHKYTPRTGGSVSTDYIKT